MSGVMQRQSSCSPNEMFEYIVKDIPTERLLSPALSDPSSSEFMQHSGSQLGRVQMHPWATLSDCMKFIAENGGGKNQSTNPMKSLLDSLAKCATVEQLVSILNGYADFYQMVLYFIPCNKCEFIDTKDIATYEGTVSQSEQGTYYARMAFLMYNFEQRQFAPLYIIDNDNHSQTCFDRDDQSVFDRMSDFLCAHDGKQRASLGSNPERVNYPPPTESNRNQRTDRRTIQSVTTVGCVQANVEPTPQSNSHSTSNDGHDVPMVYRQVPTDTASFIAATHPNRTSWEQFADQIKSVLYDMAHRDSMETHGPTDLQDESLVEHDSLLSQIAVPNQTSIQPPSSPNEPDAMQIFLSQSISSPSTSTVATIEQTTSNSLSEKFESPEILKHPRRHRRVRMLKDVAKRRCPLVQAGKKGRQREYPTAAVPSLAAGGKLWLGVRAVTQIGRKHPLKCVTPEAARVDFTLTTTTNERACLQCDVNSFDPTTECVFLEVTPNERRKRRKIIKVRLFNWKQFGPKNGDGTGDEDLRFCKLELQFCERLSGQYHPVSPPSFTTLIEDVDGDVCIVPSTIEPKQLCELGGERIIVPLSVKCPKKGLQIFVNETKLTDRSFAMQGKNLVFESPAKTQDEDLHVIVAKSEKVENNPERRSTELYNGYIPYVPHGNHPHTCFLDDPMWNNMST